MNNSLTQQHIRFAKVDQGTAWVVFAILVETRDGETIAVSEPKIVKVIPKAYAALAGSVQVNSGFVLSAPQQHIISEYSVQSPYFSNTFGFFNEELVTQLAARPPTQN